MKNNSKLKIQNSTLQKSKKILVTGTAGFIGYHLVKKLPDPVFYVRKNYV